MAWKEMCVHTSGHLLYISKLYMFQCFSLPTTVQSLGSHGRQWRIKDQGCPSRGPRPGKSQNSRHWSCRRSWGYRRLWFHLVSRHGCGRSYQGTHCLLFSPGKIRLCRRFLVCFGVWTHVWRNTRSILDVLERIARVARWYNSVLVRIYHPM